MSRAISEGNKREKPFIAAALAVISFGAVMFYAIAILDASIHIAILLGCGMTALIACLFGSSWKDVEQGMTAGISSSLLSIVILLLIGVLIGVWIETGVIPTLIYYGLHLLHPRFFPASAMLICSAVSTALGSWGTAGTIGTALMGVARASGVYTPLAAGAIISGAYFGDKASPLSDSTNLASAASGVDVFTNVRHMFPVIMAAYVVALVLYLLLGAIYSPGDFERQSLLELAEQIGGTFKISPLNLLPLLVLTASILLRVPPIPGISAGILASAMMGGILQKNSAADLFRSAWSGCVSTSGNALIDSLFSAGGMESMLFSVSLVLCAMMLGGIMAHTGLMKAFMAPVYVFFNSAGRLIAATVLSGGVINVIIPEQYIAITLPGQMLSKEYDRLDVDRRELARALGAGGAALSPLIPWNTCGVFMADILNVPVSEYCRYAYLNLLTPVLVIALGYLSAGRRMNRRDSSTTTADHF